MIKKHLNGLRLNSRRYYKRRYNPEQYIGQCLNCLDIFSVYIDDIEGVEKIPYTYIEYNKLEDDMFKSWLKMNNSIVRFNVQNNDLVHKCGGRITVWVMNKFNGR